MKSFFLFLALLTGASSFSQVFFYNTIVGETKNNHRILIDEEFFVETIYNTENGNFILTRGGYYSRVKNNDLHIIFEFNSNYKKDSLKKFVFSDLDKLKAKSKLKQDLDGKWLMSGRISPDGQEKRRDIKRSRKTLKFLVDGHFQWIAYNTETYDFFGSGGGTYYAKGEEYSEVIDFFSRDVTRVGNMLSFKYKRNANDWYHSGLSSKGKPLNEIWTLRKNR
tara:strand:- start:3410 stop:4075 length:666 start_codon:yes stop_codon:yes gene_type:complete